MSNILGPNVRTKDWLFAGILCLLTLVSRIPFAGHFLFNSDATRFALAMERLDVSQMRPHAPGYILYVAGAKVFEFFSHDAVISLVGVSVLASGLTVAVLYLLALRMYGRSNAVVSSLLLASSPLFWFNGEMALTYAFEGLFALLFAFACYQIIQGQKRWLLISALVLGVATGIRQNLILLLLPLWVYSIRKLSFKKIVSWSFVYGVVCAAWLVPMVVLSGGLKSYLQTLGAQYSAVVAYPASLLAEMTVRGKILAAFLLYSFTFGIIPMLYFSGIYFRVTAVVKDSRLRFVSIWIFPAVIFYLCITLWNPGQIIIILPPLFLFLSESLRGLSRDIEDAFKEISTQCSSRAIQVLRRLINVRTALATMVGIIFIFNLALFLFLRTPVSYAAIREGDRGLSERIRLTQKNFAPDRTIILACQLNTQAGYYLPDYLVYCPFPLIFDPAQIPIEIQNVYISLHHQTFPKSYWIDSGFEIQPISIPEGIDHLVIWEKDVAEFYENVNRPLIKISSDQGDDSVYSVRVNPGDRIVYQYQFWTLNTEE